MLDQTQVADRAGPTEEEIRQIVRQELERSQKRDPATLWLDMNAWREHGYPEVIETAKKESRPRMLQ